jgi:hypothetical protein
MKTKFQCLFIGLALLAVVHPVLAQPALGIVPTNNQALLYWPATATDYVLQSSTNLASTNWTAIYTVTNSANAVTFIDTNATHFPHRFYRVQILP